MITDQVVSVTMHNDRESYTSKRFHLATLLSSITTMPVLSILKEPANSTCNVVIVSMLCALNSNDDVDDSSQHTSSPSQVD